MFDSWPLFAVFVCAIVYTIGALCAKRALAGGATVWQVNFAANMAMSVLYLPFWLGADWAMVLTRRLQAGSCCGGILHRAAFYVCGS